MNGSGTKEAIKLAWPIFLVVISGLMSISVLFYRVEMLQTQFETHCAAEAASSTDSVDMQLRLARMELDIQYIKEQLRQLQQLVERRGTDESSGYSFDHDRTERGAQPARAFAEGS